MLTLTEMVRGFDPYRAWLDVSEMRRPLTAYQLLDLAPLEDDIEAIHEAAGQKRAALESYRDEAPPEIWLQVHDELEEAVSVLLDPDRKVAYDLALQPSKHSHTIRHGLPGGVTDKTHGTVYHCPLCKAVNPATRKFCVQCGTNLWEPCFECGTLCSAGEKYCGACGANLNASSVEHTKRITLAFQDIEQLQAVSRFEDAIALLSPIAKNDHPRLAEYAAKAGQMIRQLNAQLARRQIVAEESLQRAEQCYAAFDYEAAQRVLGDVPRSLLTEPMQNLLQQCAARQEEVETLTRELHEAVQAKRLLDCLPRIERLLAIKPDHDDAKTLSEKIQRHLIAAAEKRLAKHQYDEARRLIEQIAPAQRTPRAQEVRERAAELAWLMWDLRNAPVIDKTLTAVAERLQQAASDHPQIVKLCDEVRRRFELAQAAGRQTPAPWASSPKETALGVPVDWISGFRRLACAETVDAADLSQQPGRFAIACGLALTGIKQSIVPINLLANQHQGVLSRVTQLVRPRNTRTAWGIDLGASGLKAVKLAWNEKQQQATIEDAMLVEHAKSLMHAANEVEEKKLVGDTIARFAKRLEGKTERLCMSIPARMSLGRQIEFPPADPVKTAKLVQFEARSQFPFPLEQLAWDFHLFDNAPSGPGDAPGLANAGLANASLANAGLANTGLANASSRRALVVAVQRAMVQKYVDAFRELDQRIDVLQTDAIALHNFIAYDCFALPGDPASGESGPVVAAVDIGGDATNIVVSSPYSLWSRSCPVAGHSFTRALVNEFKLSITRAEQQKRTPEIGKSFGPFYEVLSPVFDDFLREIQQSLSAYAAAQPDYPVQRVVGLGGGFLLHGLFRYLRSSR